MTAWPGRARSVAARVATTRRIVRMGSLGRQHACRDKKLLSPRRVGTREKWTLWDLNPRPRPCEGRDLPTDLSARLAGRTLQPPYFMASGAGLCTRNLPRSAIALGLASPCLSWRSRIGAHRAHARPDGGRDGATTRKAPVAEFAPTVG